MNAEKVPRVPINFQLVEVIVDHLVSILMAKYSLNSVRRILTPLNLQLMRLFIGEPVWTALNRPQEGHPSRQEYEKNVMGNNGFALAAH